MKQITVINGPNLNMLGLREPEIYGNETLQDLAHQLETQAKELGVEVICFQSNSEGAIVDRIQECRQNCDGIILNAGGYSHTSVAIRDAIAAIRPVPVIEVHISNVYARDEQFRHTSLTAPVCRGLIAGLGLLSYQLALTAILSPVHATAASKR